MRFLIVSILNEPKMVIDYGDRQWRDECGDPDGVQYFVYAASVLNLAYIVFRPMITQMAIVWNRGEKRRFLKILGKIIGYLLAISIVLMIGKRTARNPGSVYCLCGGSVSL